MRNQSGKTFENANIKLMAGDVNKLQPAAVAGRMYAAEAKAMMNDAMAPVVREKSFDEFHLYSLARPTTLHDQETKQVEFVRSTGIHAQRLYVYDGAQVAQYGYYNLEQIRQDQSYGTQSNPKVWVMEEFKNAESQSSWHCAAQRQTAFLSPRYRRPPGICRREYDRSHAQRRNSPHLHRQFV